MLRPLPISKAVIKPLTYFNFKCYIYFYFMVFLFMNAINIIALTLFKKINYSKNFFSPKLLIYFL